MKDKFIAALLAFFLGSLGIHQFYLGNTLKGILYLVFCWTLIPAFISFIDCILLLLKDEYSFDMKYNQRYMQMMGINKYPGVQNFNS